RKHSFVDSKFASTRNQGNASCIGSQHFAANSGRRLRGPKGSQFRLIEFCRAVANKIREFFTFPPSACCIGQIQDRLARTASRLMRAIGASFGFPLPLSDSMETHSSAIVGFSNNARRGSSTLK